MANKDRAAVQSGLNDLLGNVIQRDQKTAGRPSTPREAVLENDQTPEDYDNITSHIVIEDYDNITELHYDNKTNKQTNKHSIEDPEATVEDDKQSSELTPVKSKIKKASSKDLDLQQRREEAATMANAATMTVTLRIPAALNAWLDEYVHRSWPNKIKKQDLVIEALQMLYVRRGRPDEEIVDTELLPERNKK